MFTFGSHHLHHFGRIQEGLSTRLRRMEVLTGHHLPKSLLRQNMRCCCHHLFRYFMTFRWLIGLHLHYRIHFPNLLLKLQLILRTLEHPEPFRFLNLNLIQNEMIILTL